MQIKMQNSIIVFLQSKGFIRNPTIALSRNFNLSLAVYRYFLNIYVKIS